MVWQANGVWKEEEEQPTCWLCAFSFSFFFFASLWLVSLCPSLRLDALWAATSEKPFSHRLKGPQGVKLTLKDSSTLTSSSSVSRSSLTACRHTHRQDRRHELLRTDDWAHKELRVQHHPGHWCASPDDAAPIAWRRNAVGVNLHRSPGWTGSSLWAYAAGSGTPPRTCSSGRRRRGCTTGCGTNTAGAGRTGGATVGACWRRSRAESSGFPWRVEMLLSSRLNFV